MSTVTTTPPAVTVSDSAVLTAFVSIESTYKAESLADNALTTHNSNVPSQLPVVPLAATRVLAVLTAKYQTEHY